MSQNGKGDKPRFYPDKQYKNNYNKIFGENTEMKLVDYRKRKLEIGNRVKVQDDIPSVDGILYKNQIVKIDEWNTSTEKIRVTDNIGKVWWIEPSQVSCSFLQEEMVFGNIRRPEVKFKGMMTDKKPKRARTKGRYKADDKSTKEINEAWVGGKAPKKRKK